MISFLLQLIALGAKSQVNIGRDVDMIFAHNHYSFTLVPFLDQKANISKNIDKYWVHATIMHGFEAGFNRYSHLDKKHSIIVGLFFGAFARNFNYDIPGDEFNPPFDGHITSNTAASREFNFMGSIPVLFEKRWFKTENNFFDLDIGITIRYTPPETEGTGTTIGGGPDFFNMQVNYNSTERPWLNYNLGGGYCWILKNNDIFKANLALNLSFTYFLKGSYQFTIPNKPVVEGRYEVNGTYIGLSFSYVLTGAYKESAKDNENKKGL